MKPYIRKVKTTLATISLICGSLMFTSCLTAEATSKGDVYICTSKSAKVYHSTPNCKGLNRCSKEIKKVSKSSIKRRGCKICTND